MSVQMGQVTAPTSPANIKVCDVPPGATVVLNSVEASADVFIGTTNQVSSATGAPLDNGGPTTISNPATSGAFPIYACAGTGTHIVGFVLTTNEP